MAESRVSKLRNAAIAEFKRLRPDDTFMILTNSTLSPTSFMALAKENKDVKIKYITTELLHPVTELSSSYIGGIGKGLPFTEIEGMYEIKLGTKAFVSVGYSTVIHSRVQYNCFLVIGSKDYRDINKAFRAYGVILDKIKKAPPAGIYELVSDNKLGMVYTPVKLKSTNDILHPSKDVLRKTMGMHFNTSHGMIGKALVYGDFGTGKSEAVGQLIDERIKVQPELCVVYLKCDLNTLSTHIRDCSKYKVPTIVVIEEAEVWLQSSEAKFFIGSHNEPKIKVNRKTGGMMIFITNSPKFINKGFSRAGRIDWIIPWTKDMMLDKDVLTIFRDALSMYAKQYRYKKPITISDETVLKKLSKKPGATIIGAAQLLIRNARMNVLDKITDEVFNTVIETEATDMSVATKFDANNQMSAVGFNFNK